MKITCSKEKLLLAVSKVQGAVSPRTTLPILSNVLLEVDENTLTLTTTDLDIAMRYTIPVEFAEPGSTTIPAKRLFGIIRELPQGNVNLSVDDTHVAVITCGKAYFKIVGMSRDEFPKLPQFAEGNVVQIPQSLLKEMLTKTSYAVSHDESRYVLNGIYFLLKANKAVMAATDGRRLALIEKSISLPKADTMEVILPSKAVQELVKLLEEDGSVGIALTKNQISFKILNCILLSRLIEGRFPNYKQVIPAGLEQKIVLPKEELLSAIKRSLLVTNDRSSSIKLNFAAGQLVITANTPDIGESHESLDIPYKGKEIDIAFNPVFIMDALRNIDTEEVIFEATDGENPGILRTEREFLYVLMPMRLT